MREEYRCICFDFDGTLADTFPIIFREINRLAQEKGRSPFREEEFEVFRRSSGMEALKQLGISLSQIPKFFLTIRRAVQEQLHEVQPFEGVAPMLERCAASGYTMGVLTSHDEKQVERFLQSHDLYRYFTRLLSDYSLRGKHVPLKNLVKKMGFDLRQILYVGDDERDVEAARKVGVGFVAVSYGAKEESILRAAGAKVMMESPAALTDWLCAP